MILDVIFLQQVYLNFVYNNNNNIIIEINYRPITRNDGSVYACEARTKEAVIAHGLLIVAINESDG